MAPLHIFATTFFFCDSRTNPVPVTVELSVGLLFVEELQRSVQVFLAGDRLLAHDYPRALGEEALSHKAFEAAVL